MVHCIARICQQVTWSGDAEWPKVADAVIETIFAIEMMMTSSARYDDRAAAWRNALLQPSGTHAGVRTKKAPADLLRETKRVQGRLAAVNKD